MHARGPDPLHGLDRPCYLPLQGSNPGHILHERSQAHGAQLVEKLVSSRGAVWQSPFRQKASGSGGLAALDKDLRALGVRIEGDARFVQHGPDAGYIRLGKAHIKHFEIGPAEIVAAKPDEYENGDAYRTKRGKAPWPETGQA